ncbi:MAG TPA: pantoate--beta-alanine ligase [Rhodothermales bacterium]|nr:pantoate--beta-alanine ligase [Rhodothermales bacterium]
MEIIDTVKEMQARAEEARREGRRLCLVPTMGALHAGHLRLVDEARRRGDHVTVSIFVNPTQFGPGEDFQHYPRAAADDVMALGERGAVSVVFMPTVDEMYPRGEEANRTWVAVEGLDATLLGPLRPGHFRGVTTVVSKLFHICKPHVAVFGLKDAQQFVILRQMVRDLHFDVEMAGVPTVREADGLAMSSRNVYLSPGEREQAVVLSRAVFDAEQAILAAELPPEGIVEAMRRTLAQAPDGEVDYAEIVDAETLQPVDALHPGREVLVAVAVRFGKTRLIDSAFVMVPS